MSMIRDLSYKEDKSFGKIFIEYNCKLLQINVIPECSFSFFGDEISSPKDQINVNDTGWVSYNCNCFGIFKNGVILE